MNWIPCDAWSTVGLEHVTRAAHGLRAQPVGPMGGRGGKGGSGGLGGGGLGGGGRGGGSGGSGGGLGGGRITWDAPTPALTPEVIPAALIPLVTAPLCTAAATAADALAVVPVVTGTATVARTSTLGCWTVTAAERMPAAASAAASGDAAEEVMVGEVSAVATLPTGADLDRPFTVQ